MQVVGSSGADGRRAAHEGMCAGNVLASIVDTHACQFLRHLP